MAHIIKNYSFTDLVQGDLLRHSLDPFSWQLVFATLRRRSFLAVFLYRLAFACTDMGPIGHIPALFFRHINYMLHTCEIMLGSRIGPGLLLPHPTGVVIGLATLGSNATVLQNVTLGLKIACDKDRYNPENYPIIGDKVIVSPNALILGAVRIGDNAVIGTNAVVIRDVPPNSTAVGIPAQILPQQKRAA